MLYLILSVAFVSHLEYTSTVWCSPSIEQVVLSCSDEPLPSVGKLEREHTRLMKVELVLLWSVDVNHFNVATLHARGKGVEGKKVCGEEREREREK